MNLNTRISGKSATCENLSVETATLLGTPVRLKTWSLIVTLFGDAILPRGGSISAISLGQIMEAMGIESGAVRTAVSRLASDGLIERQRDGRASYYSLARERENAFIEAGKMIYAAERADSCEDKWVMGSIPADMVLDAAFSKQVLFLQKNWFLINLDKIGLEFVPDHVMLFEGEILRNPVWFSQLLAPAELADAMRRLIRVFQPLLVKLESSESIRCDISDVQSLALRCLLIHEWRRIAFRLVPVPKKFLPADWLENECRKLVMQLYRRLLEPSEKWLDEEARCLGGYLPTAGSLLEKRFR